MGVAAGACMDVERGKEGEKRKEDGEGCLERGGPVGSLKGRGTLRGWGDQREGVQRGGASQVDSGAGGSWRGREPRERIPGLRGQGLTEGRAGGPIQGAGP